MFQLGGKRFAGSGGGGKVPDPPKIALSNKGLIQGCGAELGCSQTRYGGGSGRGCTEGASRAVGGGTGGLAGWGGLGVAVGTLLSQGGSGGLRAWNTAAVTWACGDGAGAAAATCPGPEC